MLKRVLWRKLEDRPIRMPLALVFRHEKLRIEFVGAEGERTCGGFILGHIHIVTDTSPLRRPSFLPGDTG